MSSVEIGGMSIFYGVMGEGEPLVMIQGFGQNSRQWGRISLDQSSTFSSFKILVFVAKNRS